MSVARVLSGRYTPFLQPWWGATERSAVTSWLGGSEPPTAAHGLAAALEANLGRRPVLLSSGRAAIRAVLESAPLRRHGEIVLPTYCCAAVAEAVADAGFVPVLADVDDELNLDLRAIEAVTSPSTVAVILVHLGGVRAAQTDVIDAWARGRGVFLLEDAAQSAPRKNQRWVGDATVFSAGPGKVLFGPAGGWAVGPSLDTPLAVEAREQVDRRLARFLERYPLRHRPWHDIAVRVRDRRSAEPQHGRRSTTPASISWIDAVIAKGQLDRVDDIVDRRRANARRWRDVFESVGIEVALAADPGDACKVWVRTAGGVDELVLTLWQHGVELERLYTPLHLDPRWASGQRGPLSHAEELAPRVAALPARPGLNEADWRRIERAVDALPRSTAQR